MNQRPFELHPGCFNPEWLDPEVMQADLETALEELSRAGVTRHMPSSIVHGTEPLEGE